jgi:hypothetical protein
MFKIENTIIKKTGRILLLWKTYTTRNFTLTPNHTKDYKLYMYLMGTG